MKLLTAQGIADKRVLIRAGLNVPLQNGKIADTQRLDAALPTIKFCLEHAKQVILCGHIGRPKNREPELSTKVLAQYLSDQLEQPVLFHDVLDNIPSQKLVLLENARFFDGESKNDDGLAKKYADMADVFVLDAFADMHRKQASTYGVGQLIPCCAGLLVQKEVTMLERVLDPVHPFVAILGFAKIADKLPVIEQILENVDRLLFCGAVIFTFYKAANVQVGNSLVDDDSIPVVRKLLNKYGAKIQLPTDIVVTKDLASAESKVVSYNKIPSDMMGVDIGPVTTQSYKDALMQAKTVFWNGPAGLFEHPPYDKATNEIALHLAELSTTSIVGGGDTVSAAKHAGVANKLSHVSTGGGAALTFLSGEQLPGLELLGYYDK